MQILALLVCLVEGRKINASRTHCCCLTRRSTCLLVDLVPVSMHHRVPACCRAGISNRASETAGGGAQDPEPRVIQCFPWITSTTTVPWSNLPCHSFIMGCKYFHTPWSRFLPLLQQSMSITPSHLGPRTHIFRCSVTLNTDELQWVSLLIRMLFWRTTHLFFYMRFHFHHSKVTYVGRSLSEESQWAAEWRRTECVTFERVLISH